MKRLLGILMLIAGCASAPPVQPNFKELPQAVVNVMCDRLHAEGMVSEVRVVKQTQALVSPATLTALGEFAFKPEPFHQESIQQIASAPLIPIEIPAKTCVSRFIDATDLRYSSDVMVLQFSSPFINPFTRNQTGVLARLSLGGEASTWYWVPLINRNEKWFAGTPAALSVIE